jgi:N-acyl-D-aspartate/D-glutamate deacylase
MFDWLITNAEILDGSGEAPYHGDLAIQGGIIAAAGHLDGAPAAHLLDAGGRTLTPGFLDIHRHGDAAIFRPGYGLAELAQGLTTVVNGNCGLSVAPIRGTHAPETLRYLTPVVGEVPEKYRFATLAEYLRHAERQPLPLNVGMLAGGGVLRANIAGLSGRVLTGDALRRLQTDLTDAVSDGALGVSLGLGYAPECFCSTRELLAALAPLRDSGVVIAVHMRQEGDGVVYALREMIAVAGALRTPVEISHLKAIGQPPSVVPELLGLMERAREEGVDISCDIYPYTAGSTQLIHVLPPEFQRGGTAQLTQRLGDPEQRRAMRLRMETGTDFENITRLVGFEKIIIAGLTRPENRPYEGKSLAALAEARGQSPYQALFDLLETEECGASMLDFITTEDEIAKILQTPFTSVISDTVYPGAGRVHPRSYGNTARLLERFVPRPLTLAQAVNRLTRRPADRFGLIKKGRIEPGADADLCLFEPKAIHERGTYETPEIYAAGMDWVFVNGTPAIARGAFTGANCGRVLRG